MSFLFKKKENDSNVPTPSQSPPPNQPSSAPLAVPQQVPYLQTSGSFGSNGLTGSSSSSGRQSLGGDESRSGANSPSAGSSFRMPTFHSGSLSSTSASNLLGGSLGGNYTMAASSLSGQRAHPHMSGSEPSTPPPNERQSSMSSNSGSSFGPSSLPSHAPHASFLMHGKQLMTNMLITPSTSLPSTPNTASKFLIDGVPPQFGGSELSLAAASSMHAPVSIPQHQQPTQHALYQTSLPMPVTSAPAVRIAPPSSSNSPAPTPTLVTHKIPTHPVVPAAGSTPDTQGHPTQLQQQGLTIGIPTSLQQAQAIHTHSAQLDAASQEVAQIRNMFLAHGPLSRSIFQLGDTLGTGTFGRVRIVAYTPPTQTTATTTEGGATTGSTGVGATAAPPKQLYFALKMLKKSEIIRLKQVEHIKAEKAILSRISHPFIVNLYTHFQDERNVYLGMEYAIGGELFSMLRKVGRFSNDTARFFAAEIVLALAYLHSLDIVYRDLKPENLLIDREGHIKITDFGFAKVVEDRTWTLCGTPEYLAPEIIQSKGHGKQVDWWALGILIFEMLAGYPPFYDENPFGIYQKILKGAIEFPRHMDPLAKDLIKKLLTADRTKRFGCLQHGAEDIKQHKWFKPTDWNAMYHRQVRPPFVPAYRAPNDTSNFDRYPDSREGSNQAVLSDKDKALFADF